jgi:hypothetical protein
MIELKDRPLSTVHLGGLDYFTYPDGGNAVGATCHISLINFDGAPDGPGANVFVAIPISPTSTLQEAERAVLTRAHDLLVRLASFSVDEMEAAFARKRADDKGGGIRDFHETHT